MENMRSLAARTFVAVVIATCALGCDSGTSSCPGPDCTCSDTQCRCATGRSCDFAQGGACDADTNSCSLECEDEATCSGNCGSSCSLNCKQGSDCTLSLGESGSASCEDGSCTLVFSGKSGSASCTGTASCDVTCESSCSVSCDEPCTVRCADGSEETAAGSHSCDEP